MLILHRSLETHTSIASWGEFTTTLEDVAVIFRQPLFTDHGAMSIILIEEEERTLQLFKAAIRMSNKSTYTS